MGILLDDTWLNRKSSPDTSENFQLKLDEIKKKAKTPKSKEAINHFITINNPQKQIININNPCKILPKKNIIENNEEDICEENVDIQASVNRISVNSVKRNNLHDLDVKGYPHNEGGFNNNGNLLNYNMAKNYYTTPDKEYFTRTQQHFTRLTLDDETCNNIEE
jgi:hypothetical protein